MLSRNRIKMKFLDFFQFNVLLHLTFLSFFVQLSLSQSIYRSNRNRDPFVPTIPVIETYITKGSNEELYPLQANPDSEITISEEMVTDGILYNHVVLVCNASYPINWVYDGSGAPRLYTTHVRTFEDFYLKNTYEYSIFLVLFQERFNEQQTGNYVCMSLEYPDIKASRYLYFKGTFGFPSIMNQVIQPNESASSVNLPCKATDPESQMFLYKISPPEEAENLTDSRSVFYDPRFGYEMNLRDFTSPYGTYFCQVNDIDSFWKIDLVPPKSQEVRISPYQELIYMEDFSKQSFECKAKEKVTIVQPNTYNLGTTQHYNNASEEFPFTSVLKMNPDLPLYSSSKYFKIHCQTRKTNRILHTWEFSSIGSEEITISYDRSQKRLLCCSASGMSTLQEFAKCETITDCEIKKNCFTTGRCKQSYSPKLVDAPPGCTATDLSYTLSTYMVKCSVGSKSKIVPITPTIKKDELIIYEDQQIIPPTDKILKINVMRPKGGESRYKCVGNSYFLSTNFIFAMQMTDGSYNFIDEASIDYSDPHSPVLRKEVDSFVSNIICFAPLIQNTDWVNVSIPVNDDISLRSPVALKSSSNSYFRRKGRSRRGWKGKNLE